MKDVISAEFEESHCNLRQQPNKVNSRGFNRLVLNWFGDITVLHELHDNTVLSLLPIEEGFEDGESIGGIYLFHDADFVLDLVNHERISVYVLDYFHGELFVCAFVFDEADLAKAPFPEGPDDLVSLLFPSFHKFNVIDYRFMTAFCEYS